MSTEKYNTDKKHEVFRVHFLLVQTMIYRVFTLNLLGFKCQLYGNYES